MNPYTHLRTLLDDESKNWEINRQLAHIDATHNGTPKDYTTSLDVLLPLWPEGWAWSVLKDENDYYEAKARKVGVPIISCGDQLVKTPALAMLDCLLQVMEYEFNQGGVAQR